uniref:Integrator complex subunit 1 INTS2-binding domain-containing protein n=1 Tax=Acrobeloides nanus TaxID=290746 RepID=A0A914CWE2_9BILA
MLPSQVFEILETLSNRCLSMKSDLSEIDSLLSVKTTETIDLLFEATSYALQDARDRKHTERLALKSLYWKAWELVFIWSCFNRKSLLKLIYDKYPTLRMLIRMVVTKDYNFPPSSFEGKTLEEIKQGNDQARDEEFRIVQKLEQGSIEDLFEENSNSNSSGVRDLLSKVCLREPTGCIRPPPENLYQRLQTLDLEFNFGAAFCESRNPDILFILTNEQGSTQTMSSITNMIANNRESIDQIPLQCLAQFMISTQADSEFVTTRSKLDKAITPETINSIKTRLSGGLNSENSSLEDIKTVLMFIIGKLCAPAIQERDAAISTLQWLLNGSGEKCDSPLQNLPKIQHFGELRNEICIKLSECCMMETSMERNAHYIQFISNHMSSESIHMIAARLTSLVERANEQTEAHKNVRRSLLSFYAEYMKRCSSGKISQAYVEEETHSRVVIELPNSIAKIETSEKVVSAMMKLLCESFADEINSVIDLDGSGKLKDSLHEAIPDRKFLMNIWFPDSANKRAKVTRVSDNSPMDLLPPKLKLKMLSARDEQIVKAALDGVSAKQALEFIQSFGLTPFSCSQLLSILNKSDLDTKTMKPALPYVRAYRLKGAKGSDEFLRRVDSQSDTEIKMEVDDVREVDSDNVQASSQKRWSLDPPPSILHETSKYSALKALIGKTPNEIHKMVDSQPKQTTLPFLVTKSLQKTTSQGNQKIIRDLENKGADDILKFLSGVMDQNGKLSYRLPSKWLSTSNVAMIPAGGGVSNHVFTNLGEQRLVFKVKATNNDNYRVMPKNHLFVIIIFFKFLLENWDIS